jgi:hypothetical protein
MNNEIHDKYATTPRTIKPIFIRALEDLGQLQIDERKIEITPYYFRPPHYLKGIKQHQIPRRNSKNTGRKIQRTYKNLYGSLQKRRIS